MRMTTGVGCPGDGRSKPEKGRKGEKTMPIQPHGGTLVDRFEPDLSDREVAERIAGLEVLDLGPVEASDLELIAHGGFSPLTGYMGRRDYESVLETMRLESGLPWSIPVTLSVTAETGRRLREGTRAALRLGDAILGEMTVTELFSWDRQKEASMVYGTTDEAHPGVSRVLGLGDVLVAGPVTLYRPIPHRDFRELRLPPRLTREYFRKKGWKRVAGFQTRNPIHRAHEYLQKCALEVVDGLLIHPLVGETKKDDVPADVRMDCYRVLLDGYYPKDRVLLSVFPAAMRYAGPREAIFHALVRKNYGCTHFIVGRDHAGVGNYYGSFDAHFIFDEFEDGELGITPLFFDNSFYCRQCQGMASYKTCPHDAAHHVSLSGTKLRSMLAAGELPPPELTRPEVAQVLMKAYREG
jgi:sulfate adenylyltransferase